MPYGDTWRLHRRIYHQVLNNEAAMSYRPMQCVKARQLILNLSEDTKHFSMHLHTFVSLLFVRLSPTHYPFQVFHVNYHVSCVRI